MNEIKVKLTKKARDFIKLREGDFALYTNRGGAKLEDLLVGVYAELAVYKYLKDRGDPVLPPDFEMHKKKSFSADLKGGNKKYHIKGQSLTSQNKYGTSWLFQRTDRIIKNRMNTENEYIICCTVDLENETVRIMLERDIKDCVMGECMLPWFRVTKVALYLEDQI